MPLPPALMSLFNKTAPALVGAGLGGGLGAYADHQSHLDDPEAVVGYHHEVATTPTGDHNGAFKDINEKIEAREAARPGGVASFEVHGHGGGPTDAYQVGDHERLEDILKRHNYGECKDIFGLEACNAEGADVPSLVEKQYGHMPTRMVYGHPGYYGTTDSYADAYRYAQDTPQPIIFPHHHTVTDPNLPGAPVAMHVRIAPVVPGEISTGVAGGALAGEAARRLVPAAQDKLRSLQLPDLAPQPKFAEAPMDPRFPLTEYVKTAMSRPGVDLINDAMSDFKQVERLRETPQEFMDKHISWGLESGVIHERDVPQVRNDFMSMMRGTIEAQDFGDRNTKLRSLVGLQATPTARTVKKTAMSRSDTAMWADRHLGMFQADDDEPSVYYAKAYDGKAKTACLATEYFETKTAAFRDLASPRVLKSIAHRGITGPHGASVGAALGGLPVAAGLTAAFPEPGALATLAFTGARSIPGLAQMPQDAARTSNMLDRARRMMGH